MTVNTITAPAVRTRQCPLCETPPGEACQPKPSGDHLARYLDAYTAGHLTKAYMAMVLGELVVLDGCAVIDAGPPVCPEVHPVTGLQCMRVFPPHDGYAHVAGDGSQWETDGAL